jgi:signal transduction histidine kinase
LECCWTKKEITPEECPNISDGEEELYTSYKRRVVEKCLECPRFRADLQSLKELNHPLSDILPFIITEFQDQKAQIQSIVNFLNTKTREIKFLHEVSNVLQTSMDLDEVLSVAMTAITAGKGFGMNRAFLLMTDKERKNLRGYLGVGPKNFEEAWNIWEDIGRSNLTLKEMARNFRKTKLSSERVKFQDILEQLSVPLSDQQHIFNRALKGRKAILVEDAFHNPEVTDGLARILGIDSFLVMPLISRNRRIGVIIADNCITHKPITPQDVQSLETFAFPVAFALERASLYERLQEEVDKLTAANVKLKEQQELIVKMEKMALVGRITSSIAHSIRNPLMVIGGFARTLLKNIAEDDQKREYLESIVHEAKLLEDVLEEVLNYSDSLYPAVDRWDVNQLVNNVCRELGERMAQRGVDCILDLAVELPVIYVDYKKIAYCIRTILNSAMETMSGVDQVVVKTWQDADAIVIEITDNSKALNPEAMEAMTTPFYATQELGVGLGLPLCKTILERYGNQFTLDTSPGGGTRYTLRLTINKEEVANGEATSC